MTEFPIALEADLDIEMQATPLRVQAQGKVVHLKLPGLRAVWQVSRAVSRRQRVELREFLSATGLELRCYVHGIRFLTLGPKSRWNGRRTGEGGRESR